MQENLNVVFFDTLYIEKQRQRDRNWSVFAVVIFPNSTDVNFINNTMRAFECRFGT